MPAIIRTLWGAETAVSRWIKLAKTDIPKTRAHSREECWIYVYGKANADLLTNFGYKNIVLVDENPWPDGREDIQRSAGNDFYRPWHYKWELILRAMQDHGEIIYCDWDIFCMEKDVSKIFSKLENRKLDYTLTLNCYMRPQQTVWRTDRTTWRFCVGGYWIHLRTNEFAQRVMDRLNPDPKGMDWHDEIVMSKLIDGQHGGEWPGHSIWLENYESPLMVNSYKRCPWATLSDDGYFVTRNTPVPFQWERIFRPR